MFAHRIARLVMLLMCEELENLGQRQANAVRAPRDASTAHPDAGSPCARACLVSLSTFHIFLDPKCARAICYNTFNSMRQTTIQCGPALTTQP